MLFLAVCLGGVIGFMDYEGKERSRLYARSKSTIESLKTQRNLAEKRVEIMKEAVSECLATMDKMINIFPLAGNQNTTMEGEKW